MVASTTITSDTITSTTVTAGAGTTYLNPTIGAGGTLVLPSGDEALNGEVDIGGLLVLKSGSEASGVTVVGGELDANSGATLSNVTVSTTTTVTTNGTSTVTSVLGGDLSLAPGAVVNGVAFEGGTLELGGKAAGTLTGIGTTLTGFDTLDVDKGATWTLTGTAPTTATAALSNAGNITLEGSFLFSKISGAGTATIDTSATLEVTKGVANGQTIAFNPTATLKLDSPGNFSGALDDFSNTDTIDLGGFKAVAGTYTLTNGTLDIPNTAGSSTLSFVVAGVDPSTVFTVNAGSPDETLTDNWPCYCRGTLIRTEQGEVPVEELAIGDRVVTYAGVSQPIRWIGRRSFAGRFIAGKREVLPVCIRAGALADNVPVRDLHVSPNHAMYIDGALIPAGCLVNGVSVVQHEAANEVHYFHIELAEHNVIWAEGAPAETFVDDDSRAMFHNADDYVLRYPYSKFAPAVYCAPRLEDGYAVETIRGRIAERAGVVPQAPELGELHGCLDGVAGQEVRGWAQDRAHPEAPVCLDVLVDGVMLAQTLACRYREDLQRAGLGSGRHSFAVRLPAALPSAGVLEVRRSADAALLARADLAAGLAAAA